MLFISFNQIIPPVSEIAAKKGQKDVVEILASKGADINPKDKDGCTALMKLTINNFKFISFHQIILTLFEIATNEGHQEVVEILASKGADINREDKDGWTALLQGIC